MRLESGAVERIAAVEVYQRDGWMCGICHEPIDPALQWPEPRSAPLVCNIRKGVRTDS